MSKTACTLAIGAALSGAAAVYIGIQDEVWRDCAASNVTAPAEDCGAVCHALIACDCGRRCLSAWPCVTALATSDLDDAPRPLRRMRLRHRRGPACVNRQPTCGVDTHKQAFSQASAVATALRSNQTVRCFEFGGHYYLEEDRDWGVVLVLGLISVVMCLLAVITFCAARPGCKKTSSA